MSLSSARLGLRLARREVRRHPWRSALVLLMVIVPTMGMTVGATILRTSEWTAEDRLVAEFGQADLVAHPAQPNLVDGTPNGPTSAEREGRLLAHFPPGDVVIVHTAYDRIRTDDHRAYLQVSDLPLEDPIVDGRFTEIDGRAPERAGETVLTSTVAEELDVGIGDVVTPQRFGEALTIVGLVDTVESEQDLAFVAEPVSVEPQVDGTVAYIRGEFASSEASDVQGWSISRAGFLDDMYYGGRFANDDNTDGVFWTYLGGAVALLVVGTVIAAAFAVGARRQLRSIGLLSSTGASPRTVRWYLLAQGLVGGALGAVLGVALGIAASRLVPVRWFESLIDRQIDGPITRLSDVWPIIAIGTLAAVGAAWLPARSAAQVPTLQALAGRRPQGRVPARLPLLGALAVLAGSGLLAVSVAADDSGATASILVAVAGSVAILLGALAIGPWVIAGLERFSARWPESPRLAGRSLARSRLRSSAVVGAIVAVTATLIAGTTLFRTFDAEDQSSGPQYIADDLVVVEGGPPGALRDAAHDAADLIGGNSVEVAGLRIAGTRDASSYVFAATLATGVHDDGFFNYVGDQQVAIGTPEVLDLFDVPDDLRRALDDGKVIGVAAADDAVADIDVVLEGRSAPLDVPFGGTFESPVVSAALPSVLISEATAHDVGLEPRQPTYVLESDGAITDRQRNQLELFADDLSWEQQDDGSGPWVSLSFPDEQPVMTPTQVRVLGYGLIMLVVGAVVAVGLALAAKDDKDESQVLSAVGAPPRVLRRVAALRAGLLTLTAAAIAVPSGLLPAWAIATASRRSDYNSFDGYTGRHSLAIHVDGPTLLFVVVVIPLAVMAVALGGAWVRDHLRRARPLVFAFAD